MHVIRRSQASAAHERITEAEPLVRGGRNCESEEREPRECRQHVEPQQRGYREEHHDPDGEGEREPTQPRPRRRRKDDGSDEGGGEQRRAGPEHERLYSDRVTHGDLSDQRDRQPEREGGPESLAVEPNRLGDDLADRALLGRERRREGLRHRERP